MGRRARSIKPLVRRAGFWVAVGIAVLVVGGGITAYFVGSAIVNSAFAARDALEEAVPLAETAKTQLVSGNSAGAQATVAKLTQLTGDARGHTSTSTWKSVEWLPFVGENLKALRVVAESVDDLAVDALVPAATLSVSQLVPADGKIDVAAVTSMADTVETAGQAVREAQENLEGLDRTQLVDQLSAAVAQLDGVLAEAESIIVPVETATQLLPAALGADGPRNYLLLFQNNAESRGTGGNPAAIILVNVTDGVITLSQQASSTDFNNGRATPIIELDAETEALYGDKIGRFIQDSTLTPDFPYTAEIVSAYWAETFGTPIDGVVSFDPVALSYLLHATGPVTVTTGDTISADNAVSLLLNEVYFRYTDPDVQDAFFADVAGSIFKVVTSGSVDAGGLVDAFSRAIDEGRLMYAPSDPAESDFLAGNRILGQLPNSNSEATVLGAYVNDRTGSKMDYYLDLAVDVASNLCTADAPPTFTTTATIMSKVDPATAAELPGYITGPYFTPGDISTDLVLYGPVGASATEVTLDGESVEFTPLTHLGRPAVLLNVLSKPGAAHNLAVTFTGADGTTGADFGQVLVQHTPMVRPTEIVLPPAC